MNPNDIIKEWIIPPGWLKNCIKWSGKNDYSQLSNSQKSILERNKIFYNKYKGKRCFVIGNGPSINNQNLSLLTNEIKIVMNYFHLHPILKTWQPNFYCAADDPSSYNERHLDKAKNVALSIKPEAYILPIETNYIIDSSSIYPPEKTYYVKFGHSIDSNDWDLTKIIPSVGSTSQLAIILALYLGCEPIYLLGLDHDWLAHRSIETHFYPKKEEDKGTSIDLSTYSYRTMVEGLLRVWDVYELIRNYAAKKEVPIFNATDGGFLDIFPRVNFESLFK